MRVGSNESSKDISKTERALLLGSYQLFITICVFYLHNVVLARGYQDENWPAGRPIN